MASIQFENIAPSSGINIKGESYGTSFADFNGDGWTDLWSPNHHDPGSLFLNKRDGTFEDVTNRVFLDPKNVDPHGSAWADFDNDGDQDLSQSIGGAFGGSVAEVDPRYFNQLFVNLNGKLDNRAGELGVADPGGRGRSPLWVDYDNDGLLDLVLANGVKELEGVPEGEQPPSTIFRQTQNGRFEEVRVETGFDQKHARYGILTDITNDGRMELIFPGSDRIYEIGKTPFKDISRNYIPGGNFPNHRDIAAADFNGDLKVDLYLAREQLSSDYAQPAANMARVLFREAVGKEQGLSLKTQNTATLTFRIRGPQYQFNLNADQIFIGSTGINPRDVAQRDNAIEFTIPVGEIDARGIAAHQPGVDRGLYIGFDQTQGEWTVLWSNNRTQPEIHQPIIEVESTAPISDLSPINFAATRDTNVENDILLLNTGRGFEEKPQETFRQLPGSASSVTPGDFDNDMDVDLYIVTTGAIANTPNVFYENQGDGTFKQIQNSGAEGTKLGLGESVVTSDYDQDGFLDLYVTNGRNILGTWFHDEISPNELFKNKGNNNHWLQVDLEGTISNRDGIGSQVFATVGGVTQLREQGGATHTFAQNDKRIHFGLAENRRVGLLEVRWVSGTRQQLTDIAADQILRVVEGVGSDGRDTIKGSTKGDRLDGKANDDSLTGDQGEDRIIGGNGDDILAGGSGDDTLVGGTSQDKLTGGGGRDTFQYGRPSEGADTLTDFSASEDVIELTDGDAFGLNGSGISEQQFALGTAAQDSSDRFIYDQNTGDLFFDVDGAGTTAQQRIATLSNREAIGSQNFRIA